MYDIYIIFNKITNKVYVGQSVNWIKRTIQHRYQLNHNKHSNKHLQLSWNKYRKENFECYLYSSYKTKEEANVVEISLIQKYKELGICYNVSSGGDGGGKHSEETKEKIRQIKLNMTEETKQKIRDARAKQIFTSESIEKRRQKNLGSKRSEETKKRMREARLGKICLEESKQKMSESAKIRFSNPLNHPSLGKHASEETKKKSSDSHKGKNLSEEHKRKIGESGKDRIVSEETKQKISKANTGKHHTEETKRKISEAAKNISEETRQKMRESAKRRCNNIENISS